MSSPDDLISLRYSSFRDFLESNSGSLSNEGMFVETERPRPVGSRVRFELTVGYDFMLFRGEGSVAWARDAATARGGAPGMAIRFEEVANPGRRLLEKVVRKYEEEGAPRFDLKGRSGAGEAAAAERDTTLEEFLRQDLPSSPPPEEIQEILASDEPEVEILEIESPAPDDLVPDVEGPDEDDAAPEPGAATLEELMAEAAAESAAQAEPPSTGVDLPGFQEPPPMEYRTGLSAEELAGSQAARNAGGVRRRWLIILLLVVALAAVAAWIYRDRLLDLVSGGDATTEPVQAVDGTEPDAAPEASDDASVGEEGAPDDPDSPGPDEEPADATEPPAAAALAEPEPAGPAFTGVDSITWRDSQDATVVVVRGDGMVPADAVSSFRVDQGRPREVVEIAGASRPYVGGDVQIGGSRVVRIRTGFRVEDGGVLRVVADLAGPDIRLQDIAVEGPEILITLASRTVG